jgi:hypothetical protein
MDGLVELLDEHSPLKEDPYITDLKQALQEAEQEVGRLVDAARYNSFSDAVMEALTGAEDRKKELIKELGEAAPETVCGLPRGMYQKCSAGCR